MGTPIGRILLIPRGDYNGSAVYNALDWVRHSGAAWVCTTDNTTGVAPAAGVSQWQLLANDGSIGGWDSLTGKPFETLGDGVKKAADDSLTLNIDSSLLLGSQLSVNTQDTYSSADGNPISGIGVSDALDSYYTKTEVDTKLEVVVKYGGKKTFAQLDSTLLTSTYENNFFMLSDNGYITSSNINYWSDNYVVGDHIMTDSHIAVIEYTGSDPSKGTYVFDDFGGFVEVDEYTSEYTQANGKAIFDDLNPAYGYEIEYVIPSAATGDLSIPKFTNINKSAGTNTGIKLTYTISGGTDGSSKFRLRIKK